MIAIIVGENRMVIGKVKLKDWEMHHWYLSGTQLYKMYPDAMTRINRTKYGRPIREEEGQMWRENAVVPYHPKGQYYGMDKQLSEIVEHKLMVNNHKVQLRDLIARNKISIGELSKAVPMIIAGIVILWALMG